MIKAQEDNGANRARPAFVAPSEDEPEFEGVIDADDEEDVEIADEEEERRVVIPEADEVALALVLVDGRTVDVLKGVPIIEVEVIEFVGGSRTLEGTEIADVSLAIGEENDPVIDLRLQ